MTIKLTEKEEREMEALKETTEDQQDIDAIREEWLQFLQHMVTAYRWSTAIDAELQALREKYGIVPMSEASAMDGRSALRSMARWAIQRHRVTRQTGSSTDASAKTTAGTSKTMPSPSDDSQPGQTRRSLKR